MDIVVHSMLVAEAFDGLAVGWLDDLVGKSARFAKTIGEFDVYQFAGVSGDFYAAHVNEAAMKNTSLGRRVAHGALLVAYMSAASTRLIEAVNGAGQALPVSLGYDRVRFTAPVFLGDTVTVDYRVTDYDASTQRSTADVEVRNQRGEIVAVAAHLMKWLASESPS